MTMNPKLNFASVSTVVLLLLLSTLAMYAIVDSPEQWYEGGLRSFDSKSELEEFLKHARGSSSSPLLARTPTGFSELAADAGGGAQYSETNVQTAGVDESDVIKTDGEYIYVSTNSEVEIVRATPPEDMQILSTLTADDIFGVDENHSASITGLFVRDDKLVVLGSLYQQYDWYRYVLSADEYKYEPPKVVISVFDVSDRSDPSQEFSVGISGSSLTSRMLGDVVYVLTQMAVWDFDGYTILPSVWQGDTNEEIPLSSVRYDPETRYASSFVNILAIDISDGGHEILSVVAGWASTVYMSLDSIYFAVQKWDGDIEMEDGDTVPDRSSSARTTIYQIAVEGTQMTAAGSCIVRGWLLNQFSMDQHGEHLRVATTTSWINPENAVYVLDSDMQTVGALEGLAPTERIYSARFVGETLYLVTFRQVDPLFVIDLSDPANPKVAGELKIPGFSTYLHPVDDTHVLGIGQENANVKVSLFDVSDPTAPVEQSTYVIGGLFGSQALYDHKAVLFDLERELLVIPGYEHSYSLYNWSYEYSSVPAAYVLEVSLSEGISLKGVIRHEPGYAAYYSEMTRSLYIGDYLYTLSCYVLQANLLKDLSFAGKVSIDEPYGSWDY
ncbi:MAG: beta-propeller domain-containing protein [Candidatus Thermoplasmatota archaeon]|nr:beta-propeller domain-containing protein [Candidatus Thermoplasmatota archaeon]